MGIELRLYAGGISAFAICDADYCWHPATAAGGYVLFDRAGDEEIISPEDVLVACSDECRERVKADHAAYDHDPAWQELALADVLANLSANAGFDAAAYQLEQLKDMLAGKLVFARLAVPDDLSLQQAIDRGLVTQEAVDAAFVAARAEVETIGDASETEAADAG